MASETRGTPRHAGYSQAEVTQAPTWHGLVVWDLLFNNLTTGLFLVAALAELARPSIFGPIGKVAYPVAFFFLLVDLACLVFDLGSPTRFHHMLRVFKPSSPMSLGTWCLTVYSMPLTVVAAIDVLTYVGLLPRDSRVLGWVHWLGLVAGLLPALGSAAYKGVLFSTSSQPGWKDSRWLGAYLVNSAFLIGATGLMTIASFRDEGRAGSMLGSAIKILVWINVILLARLALPLIEAIKRTGRRGWPVWACLIGSGVSLFVTIGFHDGGRADGRLGRGASTIVFAAILIGAYAIRWALVKIPHLVRGPDHLSSEA